MGAAGTSVRRINRFQLQIQYDYRYRSSEGIIEYYLDKDEFRKTLQ